MSRLAQACLGVDALTDLEPKNQNQFLQGELLRVNFVQVLRRPIETTAFTRT
jgi:hypothetical protein